MAANAGAIRAGKAFVELFADDTKLARGMKVWEGKLKAWGARVSSIGKAVFAAGAAVAAPLSAATKLFSDMGSDMVDMSARTGASVEALSTLGFAAGQTGAEIEDLETGLKKAQKAIVEASHGSDAAREALGRLGLSAEDLINLKPEDQFRAIAARIAKIENPAQRAAAAMEIFGKSGTKLLPMIQDLAALEARARALGIEMSGEDANAADALGDAWGELWETAKMGVFQIGAALAPTLQELVGTITEMAGGVVRWVRDNRELVVSIAKIAAGVALAGAALFAIGSLIAGVGMAFGALVSVIGAIGTALGVIGSVLAFLVSPVGLLIAALALLGYWFFTATAIGQQALAFLSNAFNTLMNDALTAFQGIKDALAAGDIALAAKVLWTALKVVWLEGTTFLQTQWQSFLTTMVAGAVSIAKAIADVFIDMAVSVGQSLLSLEGVLAKALGKDLIDPKTRKAMQFALPALGAALKPAIGGKLDDFAGSFNEESQAKVAAAQAELAAARADFSSAVEQAATKREAAGKALRGPGGTEIPLPDVAQIAERKGIGFEDVRSKEGFKSIASALRQGRDDAARQTARNVASLLSNSNRGFQELRRIRQDLENLSGADFSASGG